MDGALGVVLARRGDPEHRDDRVTAELDEAASVLRAEALRRGMEGLERGAQRLGVRSRGAVRRRELREHAGDPAARGGSRRGGAAGRRPRRRQVVAQDRRLERTQLRRGLDPEALDQRAARGAVRRERVGLAPGVVERRHLQPAQALVERMGADQRVELGRDGGMAAAGELRLEPVAETGQPELFEPGDLGLGEALARDVGEGGAAPQLQRVAKRRGGRGGVPAGELLAPARGALLEAVGVEPAGCEPQRVAAARALDDAVAERRAQARGEDLDRAARVLRAALGPELVDDPVVVHRGTAVDQQQREERERAPARQRRPPAARRLGLDRAEDPDLHVHLGASLSRTAALKAI